MNPRSKLCEIRRNRNLNFHERVNELCLALVVEDDQSSLDELKSVVLEMLERDAGPYLMVAIMRAMDIGMEKTAREILLKKLKTDGYDVHTQLVGLTMLAMNSNNLAVTDKLMKQVRAVREESMNNFLKLYEQRFEVFLAWFRMARLTGNAKDWLSTVRFAENLPTDKWGKDSIWETWCEQFWHFVCQRDPEGMTTRAWMRWQACSLECLDRMSGALVDKPAKYSNEVKRASSYWDKSKNYFVATPKHDWLVSGVAAHDSIGVGVSRRGRPKGSKNRPKELVEIPAQAAITTVVDGGGKTDTMFKDLFREFLKR